MLRMTSVGGDGRRFSVVASGQLCLDHGAQTTDPQNTNRGFVMWSSSDRSSERGRSAHRHLASPSPYPTHPMCPPPKPPRPGLASAAALRPRGGGIVVPVVSRTELAAEPGAAPSDKIA